MCDKRVHVDIWEGMRARNDSRFVRDLSQVLWGTETLKKRCLNAEKANKYMQPGEEARVPLSPEKLEVLTSKISIH